MDDVARFFGWFCIAMLCLGLAAGMAALAAWQIGKLCDRLKVIGAGKERRAIGWELISSAQWFSESEETYQAMKVVGEVVRDGCRVGDDSTRNEWRKRVKEK